MNEATPLNEHFLGTGFRSYGWRSEVRDGRPTGYWITTKWRTVLFLPIRPLDSYRVQEVRTGQWSLDFRFPFWLVSMPATQYFSKQLPLDRKQALSTVAWFYLPVVPVFLACLALQAWRGALLSAIVLAVGWRAFGALKRLQPAHAAPSPQPRAIQASVSRSELPEPALPDATPAHLHEEPQLAADPDEVSDPETTFSQRGTKIVDRRMFDSDGNRRT